MNITGRIVESCLVFGTPKFRIPQAAPWQLHDREQPGAYNLTELVLFTFLQFFSTRYLIGRSSKKYNQLIQTFDNIYSSHADFVQMRTPMNKNPEEVQNTHALTEIDTKEAFFS